MFPSQIIPQGIDRIAGCGRAAAIGKNDAAVITERAGLFS